MRRNQRVFHARSGQYGIVFGRKDDKVAVHWGTSDRHVIVTWVPRSELVLAEGPVIPEIVLP